MQHFSPSDRCFILVRLKILNSPLLPTVSLRAKIISQDFLNINIPEQEGKNYKTQSLAVRKENRLGSLEKGKEKKFVSNKG